MRETLVDNSDLDKMSQTMFQEKLGDYISLKDNDKINEVLDVLLDGLTEMQRTVLLLRYGESWTLKKVAEHLAISIRTVRTHQSRAENAIKENLTTLTQRGGSLNKVIKKSHFTSTIVEEI